MNFHSLEDYYEYSNLIITNSAELTNYKNIVRVEYYKNLRSYTKNPYLFYAKLILTNILANILVLMKPSHLNQQNFFIIEQYRTSFIKAIIDGKLAHIDNLVVCCPYTYIKLRLYLFRYNSNVQKKIINMSSYAKLSVRKIFAIMWADIVKTRNSEAVLTVTIARFQNARKSKLKFNFNSLKKISSFADTHLFSAILFDEAKLFSQLETEVYQHGKPGAFHFPVLANRVYCWTKNDCEIYRKNGFYGQSTIIGNPFREAYCNFAAHSKRKNVVLYVTRQSEMIEKSNFDMFVNAADNSEINYLIKLRPDASLLEYLKYNVWLMNKKKRNIKTYPLRSVTSPLEDALTLCICTYNSSIIDEATYVGVPILHLITQKEQFDTANPLWRFQSIISSSDELSLAIRELFNSEDHFNKVRLEQSRNNDTA